jgi:hypothetical protein
MSIYLPMAASGISLQLMMNGAIACFASCFLVDSGVLRFHHLQKVVHLLINNELGKSVAFKI